MSNIDLRTCVPGQLLKDGRGRLLEYKESIRVDNSSFDGIYYKHLLRYQVDSYDETFTDNGIFDVNSRESHFNIVEILPLAKPEQPKSDKHPSVAWWESCPWITDRTPTEEDGNTVGWVMAKLKDSSEVATVFGPSIKLGQPWIHRQDWQPPVLSDKEQALELLNKHEDGWCPTPKEWTIIRKGLAE